MAAAPQRHPFDRCHELFFAVNLCCVIVEEDAKEGGAPFHTVSRREMRGMLRSLEVSVLVQRPPNYMVIIGSCFIYTGPLETTSPAEFEGITGPEWPSLPPSQPVKKTSAGTPPSAWLQPIQAQWEQQQSSTAHQKSSAPPLACATSAGMPTAPGVPTYPPEQLRSHQSHQTHLPRERYSSDPSNSRPPPHESPVQPPPPPPPPLVSHKLAEHHPDLHPELPQVKPSSFVSQTHQMCKSVSHVSPVQPSKVEPKGSSYLSFSLAALLSEALSSTESKFDSYQAATSDDVLPEINNMVRIEVILGTRIMLHVVPIYFFTGAIAAARASPTTTANRFLTMARPL